MSDERKDMLQKQQECKDFFMQQAMKYLPKHKKMIEQAQYYKKKVKGFEWDFVDSLIERVEEGKPLSYRQSQALRKILYKLHWDMVDQEEAS